MHPTASSMRMNIFFTRRGNAPFAAHHWVSKTFQAQDSTIERYERQDEMSKRFMKKFDDHMRRCKTRCGVSVEIGDLQ